MNKEALHKLAAESLNEGLRLDDWDKIGCVNHDCDKCKAQQEQLTEEENSKLFDLLIEEMLAHSYQGSHDYAEKVAIEIRRMYKTALREALAEQPAQQEPTKAMIDAAERIDWSDSDVRGNIVNMWQAMCAVAPQPHPAQQEPVTWGVDWGKAGDIPCVSIIKRLPDGGIEVMACEYAPYSYTTPQAQQWPMTDEMVTAAARALNKRQAEACGVDKNDHWKFYGDDIKVDARAVLEAAHGITKDQK